jgi:hypothetical protein
MDAIRSIDNATRRITVSIDEDPFNPREDENLGITAFFHKRYNIGDTIHNGEDPKEVQKWVTTSDEIFVWLPVYIYDHSGITISTHPFPCPWDSGLLGYIYATKERVLKAYGNLSEDTKELVKNVLIEEVNAIDRYLNYTYYCVFVEENGEVVDQCCGLEDLEQIKSMLYEYLDDSWNELIDKIK